MDLKMRPLQTTEQVLTWLCLLPADKMISDWRKLSYILLTAVIVTSIMAYLPASVAYFMRFYSTNLDGSFYALFQITGLLPIITMIVVSFGFRHKIKLIFDKFTKIYAESKEIFHLFHEVQ